jgi:hypothetical protein
LFSLATELGREEMAPQHQQAIQYTTLTVHAPSVVFDPMPIPAEATCVGVSIDRSVPNGLNFQDSSLFLSWIIEVSGDAGVTWREAGGGGTRGGVALSDHQTGVAQYSFGQSGGGGTWGSAQLLRAAVSATGIAPQFPVGFYGLLAADPVSVF